MSSPNRRMLDPADASVVTTVRGVPSWGAVLLALIGGGIGIVAGRTDAGYTIGWTFGLCFVAGTTLAVLAVRRRSLFTAMVQAPIVLTIVVFGTFRLLASEGTIFSASKIVTSFPIMAIATGIALLLGLVRIIAQPVRPAAAYPPPGSAARI